MCFQLMFKFVNSWLAQFWDLLLGEIITPSALSEDWVLTAEIIVLGWEICSLFFQFLFCWELWNITKSTGDFYSACITPLLYFPELILFSELNILHYRKETVLYRTHSVSNFNNLEPGKGKLKLPLSICHIFLFSFQEDPKLKEEATGHWNIILLPFFIQVFIISSCIFMVAMLLTTSFKINFSVFILMVKMDGNSLFSLWNRFTYDKMCFSSEMEPSKVSSGKHII